MSRILKLIGGTQNQYNLILATNYQRWCEIHAKKSDRQLQKIMLDQTINKWYITELKKLEADFLRKNAPVLNSNFINHKMMKQRYFDFIQIILTIYPKPLLEKYESKTTQFITFNHN
jgi:hypothetical protein